MEGAVTCQEEGWLSGMAGRGWDGLVLGGGGGDSVHRWPEGGGGAGEPEGDRVGSGGGSGEVRRRRRDAVRRSGQMGSGEGRGGSRRNLVG